MVTNSLLLFTCFMFFFTLLLEFLCSMQQYLHYKNLLEPTTIVIKLHYCHHWERKLNTPLVKNSKVVFPTEGRTKKYECLREYLETQRGKKKDSFKLLAYPVSIIPWN